ncbi:IclR family transcriptional regulator [Mesobacillus campisalis]|uniref:Glycerol operon regulatory protein n=1 Tax=Mesobacillus campisalis TaxID=1408103 RepID=A0A0M2SUY7_9BACI|nr:IclR family transcriptional regulator [Mesobacillus campisalis]KKK36797.1 IclR family transcriptional regulator [Mesobacillus campisalis]
MPIIQSVDRALRILDLFDEYETELKITDISEKMHLHKSTVHSLLKTLQSQGYIEQNLDNGKYRLGMKLFERGNLVIRRLDLRTIAKKHLIDLSVKTQNTVHLVILDGREGIYIDKVEGTSATVLYSRIGRRIPLHSSAVGKALVANKTKRELQDLLKGYEYIQQTDKTITSEEAFIAELEAVKQNGFAIDKEENEPGITCVAVPIWDHSGTVIAAMSMSQHAAGVDQGKLDRTVEILKQASVKISKELGYEMSRMAK